MATSGYNEMQAIRERLAVLEEARRNGEGDIEKLERSIGELHDRISASKDDLSRQLSSAVGEWREARVADEKEKAKSQQAILERRVTDRRERGKTALTVVGIGVTGVIALLTFFGQLFGWFG